MFSKQLKLFALIFGMQIVDFVLVCVNFRAIAHLQYIAAVSTDGLICLLGWTFFKKMQREIDNPVAQAAFVLGGMIGSLIGMYVSKAWG